MLKYADCILLFFCLSKIWKKQCNKRKYKEKHNYRPCKKPEQGFIDLNDDISGLDLNITDKYKSDLKIIK